MRITQALLDELLAHVQEDPGNECCGVVAVSGEPGSRDASAVAVHRTRNVHASPLKFEIDPEELLGVWKDIDGAGYEIGGIYHSHVRSAPYPSQTDVNFAAGWPGVEWIIVGLAAGQDPDVRSFLIDGGEVQEVPLTREGP